MIVSMTLFKCQKYHTIETNFFATHFSISIGIVDIVGVIVIIVGVVVVLVVV